MSVKPKLKLLVAGLATALAMFSLAPVGASSANISKSYKADGSIANGSLVSLDGDKSDYVQPANSNNAARLLGVAVASQDSLLAVDATAGNVQVATSGTASVLVSDLNGDIKVGDQITVSPFDGVGQKQTGSGRVIGLAQTGFSAQTDGATTQTVTDTAGKKRTIHLGFTRVNIGAGISNSSVAAGNEQLNALQKLVKSITGHTVSTWRAAIALIIVLVAATALISLTYAAIYGSIISVGRNPLGAPAVFRTLRSVLAMTLITALVAGISVYFLLH